MNISYVIRDEKTNIYMMTEGAVTFPEYAQIFLCKKTKMSDNIKKDPILLDSKKSDSIYQMSQFGISIEDKINIKSGIYAAEINTEIKIKVSRGIFEKLNEKYFHVWDVSAPYEYFNGAKIGYLIIFRVFSLNNKINDDLLSKGRKGRNSYYRLYDKKINNFVTIPVDYTNPILNDINFNKIKNNIINITHATDSILEIHEY